MSYRELLESAVAAAGYRCVEFGNARVTVEDVPLLGTCIPVSHHYARALDDMCPVLGGGEAAWLAHEDLWAALDPYLGIASYGEVAWARRERVTA